MDIKKASRLTIYKELIGTATNLQFSYNDTAYRVPIDYLYNFLETNTNVLKTSSWINRGIYHWPRPTKKLIKFLQPYIIPMDDEDEERNIYWYEMYQKLVEYKSTYGHCYVPSDYNQTNYGVQNPLVTWYLKTRGDMARGRLSKKQLDLLRNIGFLKFTQLKNYFNPENESERENLIESLNSVKVQQKSD